MHPCRLGPRRLRLRGARRAAAPVAKIQLSIPDPLTSSVGVSLPSTSPTR